MRNSQDADVGYVGSELYAHIFSKHWTIKKLTKMLSTPFSDACEYFVCFPTTLFISNKTFLNCCLCFKDFFLSCVDVYVEGYMQVLGHSCTKSHASKVPTSSKYIISNTIFLHGFYYYFINKILKFISGPER